MIPISLGNDTHAMHAARAAHKQQHAPSRHEHGPHARKGGGFASSLEGALADGAPAATRDAEPTDEEKKKKLAPGIAQPQQQPSDPAAALAFAVPRNAVDAPAPDAEGKVDTTVDPKLLSGLGTEPNKLVAAGDAKAVTASAATTTDADPADAIVTLAVDLPTAADAEAATTAALAGAKPPVPAPAAAAEAAASDIIAKTAAARPQQGKPSGSEPLERTERMATTRTGARVTASATTAGSPTSASAKVSEAERPRAQSDANDPQSGNSGEPRHGEKRPMTLAESDKKAKVERAKDDDMSVGAARTPAPATTSVVGAHAAVPADTAKTMTAVPANGTDASKVAENAIHGAGGVGAKGDDAVRAAEAAGHKRTLAAGEASGQLVTPELGRVEVVANLIGGAHEGGRVEVHVRAVEEHAKQVIAANAESLREHVRVEVPNATVHVQKPSNDLLGNGTSARDFSERSAENTARDGARDGRGDAPAARDATVKKPTVRGGGARVRFVL